MGNSDRGKGKSKENGSGSGSSSRSKKGSASATPIKVLFTEGSKVEVSSDEEGFKDAWYVATLLKPPSFTPGSRQGVRGKAWVEYETLVSEVDESKPLTELVEFPFIRPLPPVPEEGKEESFEPHDVVDAFYRDGWWKGVVNRVVEGEIGKSYGVVFEKPPQEIMFGGSKLRFHLDWVTDSWTKPSKQQRMKGLTLFSKGMPVEVNLKQNSEDVWFPATIVDEIGFNSFLVMRESLENNNENGLMNITVDAFHIQPCPPKLDLKCFNILERVDVFYNSGWRDGFIIKILGDDQFMVLLKHTKEEKQFGRLEIRPHLYWNEGKWLSYCRDTDAPDGKVKPRRLNKNAKNSLVVAIAANGHREASPWQQSSAFDAKSERKRVKQNTPNSSQLHLPKKFKAGDNAHSSSSQACSVDLLPVDTPNQGQVSSSVVEVNLPRDVDVSCQEKKGMEHIVLEGGAGDMDNHQDLTMKEVELLFPTYEEPAAGASDTDNQECIVKEVALPGTTGEGASVKQGELPLVTCEEPAGHSPGDTAKQWNDSRKREGEPARKEPVMHDMLLEPMENNEIPFVKSSPIWEGVESMEVFRSMPQKPHFRPLLECPEEKREGMAIGFMIVFANLVEKTSKLNADIPKDVFDRYLTSLADLELFGFDVRPVMDRLNKLLSIKERRGQLQDRSTELQVNIVKKAKNITRLEEDIDAIDKMMRELEEKRAGQVAMKVMKEVELASLQEEAGVIAAKFSDINCEFDSAATASW